MTDRQKRSVEQVDSGKGPNPSKATSQPLIDYLGLKNGVFEPLKSGVFEPDFNPIDFERVVSILNPGFTVRYETYPDIKIIGPVLASERECNPVLASENGELCKECASS